MALPTRLRSGPFVVAITVSTAFVLSAPFIGFVRSWIRARFPGQFVRMVGGAIAILALAAIVAALRRIREDRARRYAALALAIAGAVWYSGADATGNPDVDVVQRFHFVEYGIITFLFYRAWRPLADPAVLVLPVLAGLLVGTADEWLQWFIPNRVGEIADILLNGFAIGCGLLFSLGADPPPRFQRRLHSGSLSRVGRLGAITVLALALFFHIVHLGYDIHDDTAGVFKSRYSQEGLLAMQQAKRQEWRVHPPPLVLQRVSREDQYMTEGVTHVQRRNELLAAHDAAHAWLENLILETYYAPVLDTPSYVSRTGHRWSPEQRTSVESEGGSDAGYHSTANPYPIYTWSRRLFWFLAVALAAILSIGASAIDRARPKQPSAAV
jgi:VanZ like family